MNTETHAEQDPVQWETPPEPQSTSRPGAWVKQAAQLRERPRSWGILKQYPPETRQKAYDLANCVKKGKLVAFRPAGTFDATVRLRDNGMHATYVKYLGEKEPR